MICLLLKITDLIFPLFTALQVAFSVVRTSNFFPPGSYERHIGFEAFSVDVQSGFNLDIISTFRPPKKGIYVSHISAAAVRDIFVGASIDINQNSYSYTHVGTDDVERQQETCGTSYMINLEADWLCAYLTYHALYSDNEGLQTSWSMFRLDDIMQPLVGFSVTSAPSKTFSAPSLISFAIVDVNQGDGWNTTLDEFITPTSGIYFISLTTTSQISSVHDVQIQVNEQPIISVKVDHNMQATDTHNSAFLVSLTTNDTLRAYVVSGNVWNYKLNGLTLIGFLYEPVHGIKVAWSVFRTTPAIGPLEPVDFDYVMVNIGCGWNNVTSTFTTPVSGVYYLNINTGKVARKKVNFQVVWNGNPYINFLTDYTFHTGTETRGRAIMTNLTLGDSLHIKLWSGTEVNGDDSKQTSFSGFLLYPN